MVNLDYSLLWEDEANTYNISNNLLKTGTLTAWDGRNLASDADGMNLNSNLQEVIPPLQYVISALGIKLFGYNEIGARSMHAFIGVLALVMFLLLLKQHFPDSPRLRCLIFMFVALSPQLLLYFRSARYFALAVFSCLACFYLYERYWRQGHLGNLVGAAAFGLIGVMNSYTIGTASMVSIAIYHLTFRASETTKKQWLMFSLMPLLIALVSGYYLYAFGVISVDHEMLHFYQKHEANRLEILWTMTKTIAGADWLSWSVCLWFLFQRILYKRQQQSEPPPSVISSHRLIYLGILLLLFSTVLTPHTWVELRLFIAALPFLLVMKGLFIDWLTSKSKPIAIAVFLALISSGVGAFPLNLINTYTNISMHELWLVSFIKEIHRPYLPDGIREVTDYLKQHANKDDLVHVPGYYGHQNNMIPYIGNHILFCCQIETDNQRLSAKIANLRPSLFFDRNVAPDWIVVYYPKINQAWQDAMKDNYSRNWTSVHLPIFAAQAHRPEIDMHSFIPPQHNLNGGVIILKRKDNPASPNTWF
ncbi:MAG: hypothetical protein OYH77_06415 [Pseudomonadota bacterium]|nr:hypothetical protein [Pseudomonadota bacterium]